MSGESVEVAAALSRHRHPGEFLTVFGEAWLVCSCGTRLDLPVQDESVSVAAASRIFEAHQAGAIVGEVDLSAPVEPDRDEFCSDLGIHLTEALESLGVEDADWSDGRMLADTVYCLGYRKPSTPPGQQRGDA